MRFSFRRDIAIGRYVALDTPVHRLDPRTKLAAFAAVLAGLLGAGPAGALLLVAGLLGAARGARVPLRDLVRAVRALGWILAISFLFQVLWAGPSRLGGLGPGALAGLVAVLRLAGMLLAAVVLTFTTEPIDLADGLGRSFRFLERLGVPVRDLALALTLALRFLPAVLEEAQRIVLAQRARGARFEGGPLARAGRMIPLAVPLFAGCLRRADALALAMEARGFRGAAARTGMGRSEFAVRDAVALALLGGLLAAAFAAGRG